MQPIQLVVVDIVEETKDAKSFVFKPDMPISYKPGQFLTVAVPSDREGQVARCYSMSSAPHEHDLRITVKRTLNGYGSNWICANIKIGDEITVLSPAGAFTPAAFQNDLLLFAGGSGITPIISIAKSALARSDRTVALFYANRDADSVIFARQLKELQAAFPQRLLVMHWLESLQGLPNLMHLESFAKPYQSSDVFVCGPAMFMTAVTAAAKSLGIPRERYHQENFISLSGNPFASFEESEDVNMPTAAEYASIKGTLNGEEFAFDDWPINMSLLAFLTLKGIKAPSSCRAGECSACSFRLVEGEVRMNKNQVLDAEDLTLGYRLACQSYPQSPKIAITYR